MKLEPLFIPTSFGALRVDFMPAEVALDHELISKMRDHESTRFKGFDMVKHFDEKFNLSQFKEQTQTPTVTHITILDQYSNTVERTLNSDHWRNLLFEIEKVKTLYSLVFSPEKVRNTHFYFAFHID